VTDKCLSAKIMVAQCLSAKCGSAKCLSAKCLSAKCFSSKRHVISRWIIEDATIKFLGVEIGAFLNKLQLTNFLGFFFTNLKPTVQQNFGLKKKLVLNSIDNFTPVTLTIARGAQKLAGENLKVVCSQFSTLS
jgi:hypothetical protein